MPIMAYNGGILSRNGQIAGHRRCCCGCCPSPPSDLTATYSVDGCPSAQIDNCQGPLATSPTGCVGLGATQCWGGTPEMSTFGCGDVLSHELYCVDGAYTLRGNLCNVTGPGPFSMPMTVAACDPFHLTGTTTITTSCCTATLTVDIVETPP